MLAFLFCLDKPLAIKKLLMFLDACNLIWDPSDKIGE